MDNENFDSFCGIYCGACEILMTYKTGAKSKLASFWNEKTVKSFQKKIGIHYDENKPFTYKCNGCKGDTQFINCSVCQIRGCAIRNKVDHCIDCSEYPCNLIIESKRIVSILPHLKNNHSNMEMIRKVGVAKWLSEQEDIWKCPNCNTSYSWYTKKCKNCGEDLKNTSFQFSFFKAMILKLGIYLSPSGQK